MNDDRRDDRRDDALAAALRARAGGGPDTVDDALDAVTARSSMIRRRRAVTVGGVTLIAIAVGGLALIPGIGDERLAPADSVQPPTGPTDPDRASTEDTVERSPVGTDPAVAPGSTTTEADRTADAPPSSTPVAPVPSSSIATTAAGTSFPDTSTESTEVDTTPPPTTVTTVTSTTGPGPTSTVATTPSPVSTTTISGPTSTPQSTVPTSTVAPFTETFDSTGGSITVSWDGVALSLLSVAPAADATGEIEQRESLRIRVRFRGDDIDARIEVRIDDGRLRVDID